jgi:hypothetical protein
MKFPICIFCDEPVEYAQKISIYEKSGSCYNHGPLCIDYYDVPEQIIVSYKDHYVRTGFDGTSTICDDSFIVENSSQLDDFYLYNHAIDQIIAKINTFINFK